MLAVDPLRFPRRLATKPAVVWLGATLVALASCKKPNPEAEAVVLCPLLDACQRRARSWAGD